MTALSHDDAASSGKLLPLLTAFFYLFFTLIPNSHSLMVQWPWVLFWQVGLLCPIIWLLWLGVQSKFQRLGYGWDYLVVFISIGLVMSALFARFYMQARWYSWGALGYVAALYVLHYRLSLSKNKLHLLIFQGYVSIAFIIISLTLWIFQTLLPELNRLATLRQAGIMVSFDFSTLTLRNWVPLGHQNYVAGYLILVLPLLVGLSLIQTGWQRKVWITGFILGLINLYTTSSRGGWLGLGILCLWGIGVLLFRSRLPKQWILLGGLGTIVGVIALALANNRLRGLIFSILQGKGGGELAYRYINGVTGWKMGSSQPLTGLGLGHVPHFYQKFRPFWAGREAEAIYQLHSTPVQLWAEMGLWGVLSMLGIILGLIWLIYNFIRLKASSEGRAEEILFWCAMGGLLAYSVVSLTDYQLDNIGISGVMVIYIASLISFLPPVPPSSPAPIFSYGGIAIVIVMIIWLIPIHRAWQLSNQGFMALRMDKIEPFQELLNEAQKNKHLRREVYYPYQLGWNLGNLALNSSDPSVREQLLTDAIAAFEKGNKVSRHHEFGHSNVGWLWLQKDGAKATVPFKKAIELVPAKRGLMYGLGLSFLSQNKLELALEALSLEVLRDPAFITSPIWRSPNLRPIYNLLIERTLERYQQLIDQNSTSVDLKQYLKQVRGGLYWWAGYFTKSAQDWQENAPALANYLLKIAQDQPLQGNIPPIFQAWLTPNQRGELIEQGFISSMKMPLSAELKEQFSQSMDNSDNFHQWLTENAPVLRYRRERLGFGVNLRHIDGVIPKDFLLVLENAAVSAWFKSIYPSPLYFPELDKALQPWREELLGKIES
ncbi:MAG: O-antigen ligase family protein [Microcystaceae cyanobacterium]